MLLKNNFIGMLRNNIVINIMKCFDKSHCFLEVDRADASQITKDHRNSPVLVPIPTWKFLFPVQLPKRYEAGETRGQRGPELNTHNSL